MRTAGLAVRLETLLGVMAGSVLFGMMLLTFVDVVLRYIFNSPLRGSFEVTELMMVVLIFAGLPLVSRHDEHVTMDFLDHAVPRRWRRALRAFAHVACGAMLLGVGWLMWERASKVAQYGDATAALKIALAPFGYVMALLIFVTAVIHLVMAFVRAGTRD